MQGIPAFPVSLSLEGVSQMDSERVVALVRPPGTAPMPGRRLLCQAGAAGWRSGVPNRHRMTV